jgi:hypothetical protein
MADKTVIAQAVQKLLTQVGDPITISPSTGNFITAEKLTINVGESSELKISYVGDNLESWFLGKVEEPFSGSQLKIQKLSQDSVDQPIFDELGSEEKAETTLYEMFEFLKTAERKCYIFYIKDASGRLRAVTTYWFDDGWVLRADEIHDPNPGDAVYHVMSRN